VKLIPKTGWFWKALDIAVRVVTFGKNKRFLTHYATTIGPWIALPEAWFEHLDRYRGVIAHERVHYEQFKKAGLGSAVLGILPLAIVYLLLPLPIGLAYGRYVLERPAYAVSIRHELLAAGHGSTDRMYHREQLIDWATEQLSGPAYGWTWPFPRAVRRWFEENA
jgi:hypothetical protein